MSTAELPADSPHIPIIGGNGEFVAAGTTCLVERMRNGDIIKTPMNHAGLDCVRDLITEAEIYQRLGEHPRLVTIRSCNVEQHRMVMEFMPHGTLKKYIEDHHGDISQQQRIRWAQQSSEVLGLIHQSGILHCDVGPNNFLLDAALGLKITDFGGSSVDGSCASVCPGIRYLLPDPEWKPGNPPTLKEDLFSLGSLLYFIFTGTPPFHDLEDEMVEKNYKAGLFPDLTGVLAADLISQCWHQRAESALQIYEALMRM